MDSLRGSDVGVLFQNADGNINMGVWFDDPDIEMEDIYWYNTLAGAISNSLYGNEGLISIDQEYNTKSCYVVLHRNGKLDSVIFAANSASGFFSTPLKAIRLE